jgi:excisionase family DNA binding protein
MRKLLDVNQVAEILNVKINTVYKYAMGQKIPYVKIGGSLRFTEEQLEDFVQRKSVEVTK